MKKELYITVHKTGKLKNIVSINTSSLSNEFCNRMGQREFSRKDRSCESICHYCYSEKNERIYNSLENKLLENSELLSNEIIDPPVLNASFVRISSFGELINETHMQNIFNIFKKNPHIKFAMMTKRYDLVMKHPKLKNVIYIASSPIINKRLDNEDVLSYFDKTFTVYDKTFDIEKENIKINCGVKGSCMECRLCYTKKGGNAINEHLRK